MSMCTIDHRSFANTGTRNAPNKQGHYNKLSSGHRQQKQVLNAVTHTQLLSDYVLDLGKVSYMEAHRAGHKRQSTRHGHLLLDDDGISSTCGRNNFHEHHQRRKRFDVHESARRCRWAREIDGSFNPNT